jgi:hypothetical protein
MADELPFPTHDASIPSSDFTDPMGDAGSVLVTCPHCEQNVLIESVSDEPEMICPHCGNAFVVPHSEFGGLDDHDGNPEEQRREAELDMMRIRQLTTARRAAIRARTYLLVGCLIFATAAINLIIKTVQRVRYEKVWDARTFSFIAFSAACFMIAYYFMSRMLEISKELGRSAIEEPATPPDFSTLSDGTQTARDLEDVK